MCKAKRPTIQDTPAPKPLAQFTTPDQLYGANQGASMRAGLRGRSSLRIDAPTEATPVENDQVRDFPAEEESARQAAAAAATAAAAARKKANKKKFTSGKIKSLAIAPVNLPAAMVRDSQNFNDNYRNS